MTLIEVMLRFPVGSKVVRRGDIHPEVYTVLQVYDHPAIRKAVLKLTSDMPSKPFRKEFTVDPTFYEEYTI